ncbi:DUF397 domain-containing protein [Natronoglycomyces albus]|uniref:DUF397 domain-containing protein n=1 Tax=Natronoglycomyces albus TaxID=2811108 RepID=A0A895XH96_9ACTN|nr:DUF397 domain-containing protein [Natronoglycomyces albus]QSB04297.1 DUF397 domain-containing protein [Natronoglycomyces albus]
MNNARARQVLSAVERSGIEWRKSSKIPNSNGQCVGVGPLADGSGRVAVRHSHHPDGSVFVYTQDEWASFLTGIEPGEFDFS